MAMAVKKKEDDRITLDNRDPEEIKARILAKYPPKVARKRNKQIVINRVDPDGKVPVINSNVRTVPGLIEKAGLLPRPGVAMD